MKNKGVNMSKLLTILTLSFMFSIVSVDANANHCGGGHKEIINKKYGI